MQKKYIVRLTDEERAELQLVVKKFKGSSQDPRKNKLSKMALSISAFLSDCVGMQDAATIEGIRFKYLALAPGDGRTYAVPLGGDRSDGAGLGWRRRAVSMRLAWPGTPLPPVCAS